MQSCADKDEVVLPVSVWIHLALARQILTEVHLALKLPYTVAKHYSSGAMNMSGYKATVLRTFRWLRPVKTPD